MAINLIRFAGVTLPDNDAVDAQDTNPALESLLPILGGSFDLFDTDDALALPVVLTKQVLVYNETDPVLMATVDALRALVLTQGTLVGEMGDASERTRTARLTQIFGTRTNREPHRVQITMQWQARPTGWDGDAVDTTETMTSSPHALAVTNAGNRATRAVTLTITAGSANITAVEVAISGSVELDWTGTLLAGDALVINANAKTITNDGADAYGGFSLGAGHVIDQWLLLPAGATTIDITFTGGSTDSTVRIEFNDGWK